MNTRGKHIINNRETERLVEAHYMVFISSRAKPHINTVRVIHLISTQIALPCVLLFGMMGCAHYITSAVKMLHDHLSASHEYGGVRNGILLYRIQCSLLKTVYKAIFCCL